LNEINQELSTIDKLNENLLDISIFMKKELFLQSAFLFKSIREKMKFLKTKELKIITINYFEKVVDKKENEYFY